MLSHRLIWHGRRVCHSRRPACGACGIGQALPVIRRRPDRREDRTQAGEGRAVLVTELAPRPPGPRRSQRPGRRAGARLAERAGPARRGDARASRAAAAAATARPAAVLILFGDGRRGPDLLLVQRGPGLRRHAGPAGVSRRGDRRGRRRPGRRRPCARRPRRPAWTRPASTCSAVLPELFIRRSGFTGHRRCSPGGGSPARSSPATRWKSPRARGSRSPNSPIRRNRSRGPPPPAGPAGMTVPPRRSGWAGC